MYTPLRLTSDCFIFLAHILSCTAGRARPRPSSRGGNTHANVLLTVHIYAIAQTHIAPPHEWSCLSSATDQWINGQVESSITPLIRLWATLGGIKGARKPRSSDIPNCYFQRITINISHHHNSVQLHTSSISFSHSYNYFDVFASSSQPRPLMSSSVVGPH
jgi:hypothetical protein